jgi:hypothetical protein
MKRFSFDLSEEDRRVVRRWRLASVGLYGSILAGLILLAALSQSPDVNYASAGSVASLSHNAASHR